MSVIDCSTLSTPCNGTEFKDIDTVRCQEGCLSSSCNDIQSCVDIKSPILTNIDVNIINTYDIVSAFVD